MGIHPDEMSTKPPYTTRRENFSFDGGEMVRWRARTRCDSGGDHGKQMFPMPDCLMMTTGKFHGGGRFPRALSFVGLGAMRMSEQKALQSIVSRLVMVLATMTCCGASDEEEFVRGEVGVRGLGGSGLCDNITPSVCFSTTRPASRSLPSSWLEIFSSLSHGDISEIHPCRRRANRAVTWRTSLVVGRWLQLSQRRFFCWEWIRRGNSRQFTWLRQERLIFFSFDSFNPDTPQLHSILGGL